MRWQTKVTMTFLAERALTAPEAEVVYLAVLRAGNAVDAKLPQQTGTFTLEQVSVLADE